MKKNAVDPLENDLRAIVQLADEAVVHCANRMTPCVNCGKWIQAKNLALVHLPAPEAPEGASEVDTLSQPADEPSAPIAGSSAHGKAKK